MTFLSTRISSSCAAADLSNTDFRSQTELGRLDITRRAIGGGVLVGDSFVEAAADTQNYGLYLTDTYSLTKALSLTLSGRFNHTEIELRDRLGTALNGDHTFNRFNPAVEAT